MGIFSDIMNKIFHHPSAQAADAAALQASAVAVANAAAAAPVPAAAAAPAQPVDVEAVLTKMSADEGDHLNWRTSIVDLLKLLDLDSSLTARAHLADELGVHAADNGTAEQNIALHKAVMQKLAENGGKVPDSLKG